MGSDISDGWVVKRMFSNVLRQNVQWICVTSNATSSAPKHLLSTGRRRRKDDDKDDGKNESKDDDNDKSKGNAGHML